MAEMDSEQIIGSCNAARMHFLKIETEKCGDYGWKLRGDRYFDGVRSPTAWRLWAVNR
jgi:hypothetical protein